MTKAVNDEEARLKYMKKCADYSGQLILFTVFSIWGFRVLKDYKHMPWFMGGKFDAIESFETMATCRPFCEFPRPVHDWFLFTAGYYFGDLIRHVLFEERKQAFGEFLIHHLASTLLIIGSAYANNVGIGSNISWLHFITDIPIAAVKILSSTVYETSTMVAFLGVLIPSWFYFRLMCLPFYIYLIFSNDKVPYPDPELTQFDTFTYLNGVFLCVLQILHVYWFYLFLAMLCDYKRSGKADDS